MKKKKVNKKEEAKMRQEAYDKLTVVEKIKKLDAKYGEGLEAIKERDRLYKIKRK